MTEINDKNHISILLSSLNKSYKQAKLKGKLNSIELYIFNIIFKLLNNQYLVLTTEERKCLISLYEKMYINSKNICNNLPIYKTKYITKFFQAESTDCNNYPKFEKIYYWQEENINNRYSDVLIDVDNPGYLTNKLNDTEPNFVIGKNIQYDYIGVICFLITDTLPTDDYRIYDILNNDVTNGFDTGYVNTMNSTLFVSTNIYSHNLMNLKIKKQTTSLTNGPFNTTFNNIFL